MLRWLSEPTSSSLGSCIFEIGSQRCGRGGGSVLEDCAPMCVRLCTKCQHDEPPVRCSSQPELVWSCTRTIRIGIRFGVGWCGYLLDTFCNMVLPRVGVSLILIHKPFRLRIRVFTPSRFGRVRVLPALAGPAAGRSQIRCGSVIRLPFSSRIGVVFSGDSCQIGCEFDGGAHARGSSDGQHTGPHRLTCRTSMCYVITAIPGEVNQYLARLYKSSTRLGCPPRRTCALAAPH